MENHSSLENKENLEVLRSKIFEIDRGIINLLAERFEFVKEVGKIKKENNIPPLDSTQWDKVLKTRKDIANELGVNEELITKLLNLIHDEALRLEN